MNPANVQLISSVIQLTAGVIQDQMNKQNELLALFTKIADEGRDLTDAEVAVFRKQAESVLKQMEDINPLI